MRNISSHALSLIDSYFPIIDNVTHLHIKIWLKIQNSDGEIDSVIVFVVSRGAEII